MILAADVGGTKSVLARFESSAQGVRCVEERVYESASAGSFVELVRRFLEPRSGEVEACAVGVAGPVDAGRSQIVNLPWRVDRRPLARLLGTGKVRVLNDLEAAAWGVSVVAASRLKSLTPGVRSRPGPGAVIAAGTGLGTACLAGEGGRSGWTPSAAEGGHQGFAPEDETDVELWRFLHARHGRASVERAVSGPGLGAIFDFFVQSGRVRPSAALERELASAEDRNAAIARAGEDASDRAASVALDRFVRLYGSAAGNLALATGAVGGVFVAGGIAPKLLAVLEDGRFVEAFRAKGRLRPYLEKIPVRVVLDPRAPLLGAAACAERLAREGAEH